MQIRQVYQTTLFKKHSMEITKLPSGICTKTAKCKRVLCGFNCFRSILESYNNCTQASLHEWAAKIPVLGDSAQIHLFYLMETYWKIFNWSCYSNFKNYFWLKQIWRPMQKHISSMQHLHWDIQYNIKGGYLQLWVQHKLQGDEGASCPCPSCLS